MSLILPTTLHVSYLIYKGLMSLLCAEVSFALVEDNFKFLSICVKIKTKGNGRWQINAFDFVACPS